MTSKSPLGVLIIHGFTSSLDCVSGIREPLEALGIPTRMPVLRGHGAESPEALRNVRWTDWVTDSAVALQELRGEAEQVMIVGHSMGTLVAVVLGAENARGTFLDSLVLAAPAVQLTSPMAPGNRFSFMIPLMRRVLKKWKMHPTYADESLVQYDTNYRWAPMEAVMELLTFSGTARNRLPEISLPTLIIQSRNDTTVAPQSADIVYEGIATPAEHKRIVWFERTEHEMFRDCEQDEVVQTIAEFVQERLAILVNAPPYRQQAVQGEAR
jgi:carboxylesterase